MNQVFTNPDTLLGFPILRHRNRNLKGRIHRNDKHPAVLLAISNLNHQLPAEARELVQEMFVVRMDYEAAFDLLDKEGRNTLRQHSVHFFIKLETSNRRNHENNAAGRKPAA